MPGSAVGDFDQSSIATVLDSVEADFQALSLTVPLCRSSRAQL